ncbi:MAG: serine protease [Kiritimatiellia bacterium]
MKNLILILSIPLSSLTSAASPSDSYTDLQSVANTFAESLGGMVDKKEVLTVEEVKSQISPLKRTQVELQPGAGRVLPPDELYREALKSVVLVGRAYKCGRCSHWHENSAGGFVIHPDGYIATNYHVVEGASEKEGEGFGVRLPDGRVVPVKRIVATDRLNDLAVIQVEAGGLTPLRIADDIDIGDPVYVLSHPVGVFNTFTEGMGGEQQGHPFQPGQTQDARAEHHRRLRQGIERPPRC